MLDSATLHRLSYASWLREGKVDAQNGIRPGNTMRLSYAETEGEGENRRTVV